MEWIKSWITTPAVLSEEDFDKLPINAKFVKELECLILHPEMTVVDYYMMGKQVSYTDLHTALVNNFIEFITQLQPKADIKNKEYYAMIETQDVYYRKILNTCNSHKIVEDIGLRLNSIDRQRLGPTVQLYIFELHLLLTNVTEPVSDLYPARMISILNNQFRLYYSGTSALNQCEGYEKMIDHLMDFAKSPLYTSEDVQKYYNAINSAVDTMCKLLFEYHKELTLQFGSIGYTNMKAKYEGFLSKIVTWDCTMRMAMYGV